MDHIEYLFAGFAVFWAALFGYLLWLQARLHSVSREVRRLEELAAKLEGMAEREAGRMTGQTAAASAAASAA